MATVIGIISIDNYDDVIDKMDDKHISYLNTLITTMVSDWAHEHQAFYKRINSERYFFVAESEALKKCRSTNLIYCNEQEMLKFTVTLC